MALTPTEGLLSLLKLTTSICSWMAAQTVCLQTLFFWLKNCLLKTRTIYVYRTKTTMCMRVGCALCKVYVGEATNRCLPVPCPISPGRTEAAQTLFSIWAAWPHAEWLPKAVLVRSWDRLMLAYRLVFKLQLNSPQSWPQTHLCHQWGAGKAKWHQGTVETS